MDIISRINENYNKMSKGQKALAVYIYENYNQAVFMTAARLGEAVGVSESTVVRFASFIGYSGYPEFQRDLENWVKNKIGSVAKMGAHYSGRSQSEVLDAVLESDMMKIQHTRENLDAASFDLAVNQILCAKHVYVIGLRSCEPLARFLHFYLNMIRGDVSLLCSTNMTEVFEQMARVGHEDAVIGISFPRYSMRTLKAMEFAHDRNARVITITDTVNSPMNLYSSCNLLAKSDMVSIVDSLVAPLSVINALVVALCLKAPDQVRESLQNLEEVWNNYQVYLNDEINFISDDPVSDSTLFRGEDETGDTDSVEKL